MIRIAVDSSSDYRIEELKEKQIDLIPISITIGEDSYIDGVNLDRNGFYQLLEERGEFPKTSQPSPQVFLDLFEEVRDKGDDLIYLSLSSALSGTYQGAVAAKEIAEYDRIFLIDSLTATYNIKILADYACALRTQGARTEEIVAALEDLKARVRVLAAPNTLEYLYRGGRIGRATAALGDIANLKPIITVSKDGHVTVIGKCIGRNKAILFLLKHLKELGIDQSFPIYTIYSFGTENCGQLEEKLRSEGITPTARLQIGPTIGTHIGPEAFGIVFVTTSA